MDKNKYSLEYLCLFNNALNLISENYFNGISRENARKNKLKETDIYIYINNKDIIDEFIKFYNSFDNIKNNKNNNIGLDIENKLKDFFLKIMELE